jgi:copper transport protein
LDAIPWLYEALPKALLYASTQFVIGIAITRWLVGRTAVGADVYSTTEHKLSRMARLGASLILVALATRLCVHTRVAMGDVGWDSVRLIALESRWGGAWKIQFFLGTLQFLAGFLVPKGGRAGWFTWTLCAIFFCAALPLLGHAAGSNARLLLHATHIFATSLWLGTLTAIVVLLDDGGKLLIRSFSPVALVCSAVVVLTGVIAASLYVAAPDNLVATMYGRTLLLKLGLFLGILVCGWMNWRRVRRGSPARFATLRAELAFAAAVVLVTGILTEMEHP